MNRHILLLICLAIIALNNAYTQNPSPWFSTKEVGNKVTVISDHGVDNMYLIEGKDSSLLVDTGLGSADLASLVKKLTSKPLIVVITHGHPDHAGSDYQFPLVYIHPADSAAARNLNLAEVRSGTSRNMVQGNVPAKDELFKGKPFNTIMKPVHEGYVFNLGDRKIQVIEAPGHTPGEICLLDIENKLLFTGDNNNTLVWLFLQNSKPLHEYLSTLTKLSKRISEFSTILPGHGDPMPSDFIIDQITCVKGILDNSLERKPYKSFAGNAMVSVFGRASVTFNPDNL